MVRILRIFLFLVFLVFLIHPVSTGIMYFHISRADSILRIGDPFEAKMANLSGIRFVEVEPSDIPVGYFDERVTFHLEKEGAKLLRVQSFLKYFAFHIIVDKSGVIRFSVPSYE